MVNFVDCIPLFVQTERIHLSGQLKPGEMVRLNAIQRSQTPPTNIEPYCMDTDSADVAALSRVVIATCVTAGFLHSLGLAVGHFTHVFVDEAGQATEPECLLPISLLAETEGQVRNIQSLDSEARLLHFCSMKGFSMYCQCCILCALFNYLK